MRLVEGEATVSDVDDFVARLGALGDEYDVTAQAFDARYVVGRRHIERAVTLADRAIDRGEAIARSRAVEILLFAAGRRQIQRAMEMGLDEGTTPTVILLDGDDAADESAAATATMELLDPAETLEDFDRTRVMDFFDITETELAATDGTVADLVCERVALLVVER